MKKKKLLLTFDYELFLGKMSGSAEDCILRPAAEVIRIIEEFGHKAIFFADTTYLTRLSESPEHDHCRKDLEMISEQLAGFLKNGHEVFPHIHPHWKDAVYISDKNQWDLSDPRRYRFHNNTEVERTELFSSGFEMLDRIYKAGGTTKRPDAFRAGGWCIQPFSDFMPYFEKHHIAYDFTVLPGLYQFTNAQYFDFTITPAKSIYRFTDDVTEEDPNGKFTQFVISTIDIPEIISFAGKLRAKLLDRISNNSTFGSGIGQVPEKLVEILPEDKTGQEMSNGTIQRIAIELMSPVNVSRYCRFLDKQDYMQFVSHPKMITPDNLKQFRKFLKAVSSKYTVETDFRKMLPA